MGKLLTYINDTKKIYHRHERYVVPGALLLGFLVDNITLSRIDLFYSNLIFFFHLVVAGGSIILFQAFHNKFIANKYAALLVSFLPVVAQFSFGGLFSGYFVYYSRSASISGTWIFVVVLVFLLIGNEYFAHLYRRFVFQMSILFVALFTFLVFFVPLVVKSIGTAVFIGSGLLSLAVFGLVVLSSTRYVVTIPRETLQKLYISVGALFIVFHILYFTNAIPPLPLSLKEAAVYHSVLRSGGGYTIEYEPKSWYQFYKPYNDTIHIREGEPVYVFASVFAPTKFNTVILHEWQYYVSTQRQWETTDRLSYRLTGGRDGGYRGFTYKRKLAEGPWRVNVITESGQILSRVSFDVVYESDANTVIEQID